MYSVQGSGTVRWVAEHEELQSPYRLWIEEIAKTKIIQVSEVIREFCAQTRVNGTSQIRIHTHLIVAYKIKNIRFSQVPPPSWTNSFPHSSNQLQNTTKLTNVLNKFFCFHFSEPITSKRTDITGQDLQCWEAQQEWIYWHKQFALRRLANFDHDRSNQVTR